MVWALRPRVADKAIAGWWRTRATGNSFCIVPLPSGTLSAETRAPKHPVCHHTEPRGLARARRPAGHSALPYSATDSCREPHAD
jgi:hypothetical protein